MHSYVLEIATVPSPLVVEFAAKDNNEAIGLAARMVRARIDDLPLDGMAYVRGVGQDTAIKAATVERMALCAGSSMSLHRFISEPL